MYHSVNHSEYRGCNGSACKDESPAGKAVQEKGTHTHTKTTPKQNQKELTPPERTSREEMGV